MDQRGVRNRWNASLLMELKWCEKVDSRPAMKSSREPSLGLVMGEVKAYSCNSQDNIPKLIPNPISQMESMVYIPNKSCRSTVLCLRNASAKAVPCLMKVSFMNPWNWVRVKIREAVLRWN